MLIDLEFNQQSTNFLRAKLSCICSKSEEVFDLVAFLSIVMMTCDLRSEQKQMNDAYSNIEPRFFTGCVDMTAMAGETNAVRLETAFRVAETELGVARLLDPEVRITEPIQAS